VRPSSGVGGIPLYLTANDEGLESGDVLQEEIRRRRSLQTVRQVSIKVKVWIFIQIFCERRISSNCCWCVYPDPRDDSDGLLRHVIAGRLARRGWTVASPSEPLPLISKPPTSQRNARPAISQVKPSCWRRSTVLPSVVESRPRSSCRTYPQPNGWERGGRRKRRTGHCRTEQWRTGQIRYDNNARLTIRGARDKLMLRSIHLVITTSRVQWNAALERVLMARYVRGDNNNINSQQVSK